MKIIADLQLHSKYARAVSQSMVIPEIARWAAKKGIGLVATGDWTHPLWLRELEANLVEAAEGLFKPKKWEVRNEKLDKDVRSEKSHIPPQSEATPASHIARLISPLFLLSAEISCIYTQGGQQRRIHILIFAPSFETVEKINKEFRSRGANLMSDGRPIMGLSAKEVTELVLSVDERALLIPAHCWTPWFSLYGSASGFDSIEECFGEFTKHIYAIETGLSSSPEMNWRIAELEGRSIVSFSDAHSPQKLGREATVFEVPELSYRTVSEAIRTTHYSQPNSLPTTHPHISYTIEFYPEEGKYHYTGHRKCGVRHSPEDTKKYGTVCTVCGKKLTVGVLHRVEELANRLQTPDYRKVVDGRRSTVDDFGVKWLHHPQNSRPPYVMLVPLLEILSEALESGVSSQKVISEYEKLTKRLGPEFEILMRTKPEEIKRFSGPKVREAIMKVRGGDIFVDPGYDGEFGKVKIWKDGEKKKEARGEQVGLFEN